MALNDGGKIRFPIGLKLMLLLATAILITVVAVAAESVRSARNALQERILHGLNAVATARAHEIGSLIEQDFERAALIASRTNLRECLAAIEGNDPQTPHLAAKMNKILTDALHSLEDLDEISATNTRGEIVASTNPGLIGKALADSRFFLCGKMGYCLGGLEPVDRTLRYNVAASMVHPRAGTFIGVVLVKIEFRRLTEILKDRTGLGQTGELVLGVREGTDIKLVGPLRYAPKNVAGAAIMLGTDHFGPMRLAVEKHEGITVARDYRSAEVLAAYRHIPVGDWGLVAKIDTREAFRPIAALQTRVVLIGSILTVLSIIGAFLLSKFFSKPVQVLQAGVQKISRGQLDYRIQINTRDELGELGKSFNHMAARLEKDSARRKEAEETLRRSDQNKTILNRLAAIFLTVPDDQMYTEVVGVVREAMGGQFGLFGYIEENGDLVVPSLGGEEWSQCEVAGRSCIFSPDKWGESLWAKAVREKKTVISGGPFDLPAGHVRIDNFLAVPILYGDKTIGMIATADGQRRFTEKDAEILENIAGYISPILNARLQRDWQEQKRKHLEAQILHAQKMEAVGHLAGGVAHDFNNMLGVILGHAELSLDKTSPSQPVHADLQEIRKAALRSSDLTRQLLAFARKQMVNPQVLDLNETVESMLKMLHRLIGEDIQLLWKPCETCWSIRMDPSQIDQILANLCVNARDAIAGVGKITIEIDTVTIDNVEDADHAGLIPGEYVLLVVSDDGRGMDKKTLNSIFEPFFTTKQVGQGTGLGLATVYGIVKQNGGFINVISNPGRGTTFRIYLPRCAGQPESSPKGAPASEYARGAETILLVEDEPGLLSLARQILIRLGYSVLTASTPGEAIQVARDHAGRIHLLITDVIMPEMNGKQLERKLRAHCPGIKCLFMSGYTGDIITQHGLLDEGVHFIPKPFSMQSLSAKVRDMFDSP